MADRIRGRKWMSIRARILRRDGGICQYCKRKGHVALATEIDHVIPLHKGGSNDDNNLLSTCESCHIEKTAKDLGHKARHQIGLDGWPETEYVRLSRNR